MKRKMKLVLHWIGFLAAICAAGYVAFIAKGMPLVERVLLASSTLGGLFVALGKILPTLDRAVDELPDVAEQAPPKLTVVPPSETKPEPLG